MVDPGGPRSEMRPALVGLQRFAATIVTAKHRLFLFVDREILPDDALIAIALSDSFFLGILTSRIQCRLGAKRRWESGGSRALQQIAVLRSLPVSRSAAIRPCDYRRDSRGIGHVPQGEAAAIPTSPLPLSTTSCVHCAP